MLARSNRFSFKNKLPKNTLNSQSFNIRYEKNDEELKIAVVVSKKVDSKAVARNRIKRKIIAILGDKARQDSGLSLVFYIKKEINEEMLEDEIESALKKING